MARLRGLKCWLGIGRYTWERSLLWGHALEGSQQLQINSGVRSVLARHMVDPRGVEVGVSRSVVRLRGQIYHLGLGPYHPMSPETLQAMEGEILRIKGVTRVFFELDNWSRSSGKWVQAAPPKKKDAEPEIPEDSKP
jgi:hypothetical protein